MQIKSVLVPLLFACGIICLTSCGKAVSDTPTIVGQWDQVHMHVKDQSDHVTTSDVSQKVPAGYGLLQVGADGRYSLYSQGSLHSSGTYTFADSTFILINAGHPEGEVFDVVSLKKFDMVIHKIDTLNAGSPFMTEEITLSYNK